MADPRKLTPDMVRHLLCCVDLEPERERLRGHMAALEAELAAEKQAREEAEQAVLHINDAITSEAATVKSIRLARSTAVFLPVVVAAKPVPESMLNALRRATEDFGTDAEEPHHA